ncbi:MAG: hypothetical protein JOZ19_01905 [Rubrobacter sp.]|nr:hypothetical protein [Rubrobacter sp.]
MSGYYRRCVHERSPEFYLAEEDELFRWVKCVRRELSKQEKAEKDQERAA